MGGGGLTFRTRFGPSLQKPLGWTAVGGGMRGGRRDLQQRMEGSRTGMDSSLMERWKEKSAELMNKEQDGEHRVNERNSKVQSNRSRPYWWSRKAGNGQ